MVETPTVRLSFVPVRPNAALRLGAAALALAALLAFCLDLGRPAFWDPGEGRYAQTVREMMTSGNWLVPTLNGEPYRDKPPGFFWLIGGAFHTFGMEEWAARLPSALAALVTVLATVAFAWTRMGPAAALGAGFILTTAGQFVVLGRSVRMDMVLTMLISLTLFRAWAHWKGDARYTWPLYVLPAAGLLIKGPIAILLPVLILAVLAVTTGEYDRLRRLRPGPGIVLAMLVAATWYVPAALWAPDYLATFVWQQNVGRFLGASSGHPEPVWYFLWILPATFVPWALFLPGTIRHAVRRVRRWHDLDLFLVSWVLVPVLFFSASSAKLATYVLPVFPALALLVARYLTRVLAAGAETRARVFRIPGWIWTVALALLAIAAPVAAAIAAPDHTRTVAASLLLLPIVVGMDRALRRGRWHLVPVGIVVGGLALQVLFYRVGSPVVNEFASLRTPATLARALPAETELFVYKTRGHSFAFYDGRPLTRVTAPEAVGTLLARPAPTAVLTKVKYYGRLEPHLTRPAFVWWQGPSGRALLANRAPPAGRPTTTLPAAQRAPR